MRLERVFERVDRNGDGTLPHREVGPFPRLKKIYESADKGADRGLGLDEFRAVVQRGLKQSESLRGQRDGKPLRTRAVKVGKRERRYVLHVPDAYEPGTTAQRVPPSC